MARRIPEEQIERLRREVSLVRVVEASGVELKGGGDNRMGRCPFHEDHTPSLAVSVSKNLWHCHGACQEGGDAIAWVMKLRRASFRHAVELLRGEYGTLGGDVTAGSPSGPSAKARVTLPRPDAGVGDAAQGATLGEVAAYYQQRLVQSERARDYLTQTRGLHRADMIERFQLGFSDRTLGYQLAPVHTAEGQRLREHLKAVGIFSARGYEHFDGSLVVPLHDEAGEVVGMYGRKVSPGWKLRKGTPLHLYLPGPHRGLFNFPAIRTGGAVILCEAILDALAFYCAGFDNVTASYGVGGFTPLHLEAFKRHRVEQVFIAYDRDEAGDAAAEALVERLLAERIECFRVVFPQGMDANEYLLRCEPDEEGLAGLVRHAEWLGKSQAVPVRREVPAHSPVPPAVAPARVDASGEDASASVDSASNAASAAGAAGVNEVSADAGAPAAGRAEPAGRERPEVELAGEEVRLAFGERRYRVRGLTRNVAFEQLRVNLHVARGDAYHVDSLDLYAAKQRAAFVKQAAFELKLDEEVLARDMKQLLRRLEELHEELGKAGKAEQAPEVVLSEAEKKAALDLLRDPALLERVLADFEACGVVGEQTNKLVGYLAAVSRKLEEPLAVIIQSSSAAGKTSLMEAVLAFMPEEERVKYSAMTGQSLFYMGASDLKHKILAIVEEAGAEKASYALKLLQSEGELTIASTGKDPASGRLVTQEYRVEGPVMIFLTTTAVEVDEELLNRCLVLTVDEDREQTRAIHRQQREKQTLEGLLARHARPGVLKVHQDAQRLLKPLLVANPFARHLTFLDDRTRTRRDHVKYLTLIRSIALLHQYQREVKLAEHHGEAIPYIEVSLADVAVANSLAHQVLGRSLDELAPQTRRLLLALDALVGELAADQGLERAEVRFTRRVVRERTGWAATQLHVHLSRLVDLEYVVAHRATQGQGHVYELIYDGQGKDGTPFLTGLLDVEILGGEMALTGSIRPPAASVRGNGGEHSGSIRPGFGPDSVPFRLGLSALPATTGKAEAGSNGGSNANAHSGRVSFRGPAPSGSVPPAAS